VTHVSGHTQIERVSLAMAWHHDTSTAVETAHGSTTVALTNEWHTSWTDGSVAGLFSHTGELEGLEVCDVLADGHSAYVWWNKGYCEKHTPTNRLEIGGNGKCSDLHVFAPGTGWVSFRACRNRNNERDNCDEYWRVWYIP